MCTHTLDVMMIVYAMRLMEGLGVVLVQIYGGHGKPRLHHCSCVDLVTTYYRLMIAIFISISIICCCCCCCLMFRKHNSSLRFAVVLGNVRTINVTPSNREGLV